jgi:hypothetical protein
MDNLYVLSVMILHSVFWISRGRDRKKSGGTPEQEKLFA